MSGNLVYILSKKETNRTDLQKVLQPFFHITFFNNEADALTQIKKTPPNLLLLDHSSEDFKPFAIMDTVHNYYPLRNLPVAFLSRDTTSLMLLEKGIQSGVADYIGIPYDEKMLVEKIKHILKPAPQFKQDKVFNVKVQRKIQITTFGQADFISGEGIRFESHTKFSVGERIQIANMVSEDLVKPSLEVIVTGVDSDTTRNFPFGVSAEWSDFETKEKVAAWIEQNKALNNPRKRKVTIIAADQAFQVKVAKQMNLTYYDIDFVPNIGAALDMIHTVKPHLVLMSSAECISLFKPVQDSFLQILKNNNAGWIVYGDPFNIPAHWIPKPFQAPADPSAMAKAVEAFIPPIIPEAGRFYFSNGLEDSKLRTFFEGKSLALNETTVKIAISHEIRPPCNFQLCLKISNHSEEVFRPYVRAWPSLTPTPPGDSEEGKFPYAVECRFLAINDQQGQSLRQWLINEELKDNRKKIENIVPQ